MKPLLILLITLIGCSQEPVEIHYGSDECAHCKMLISDERFASQIVTEKGKSLKFDAIECMAKYAGAHKSELESAAYWVSDFSLETDWIDVNNARLVRSKVVKSPMGAGLVALSSDELLNAHLAQFEGEPVIWSDLVK